MIIACEILIQKLTKYNGKKQGRHIWNTVHNNDTVKEQKFLVTDELEISNGVIQTSTLLNQGFLGGHLNGRDSFCNIHMKKEMHKNKQNTSLTEIV